MAKAYTQSELEQNVGNVLGVSDWRTITFADIETFADVTGDHQWIHVDKERIAKESPFGGPVAHGYFTLSLVAPLFFEVVSLESFQAVINYGCNRVRFPAPVLEGSRIRLQVALASVAEAKKGLEIVFNATMEIDGQDKPALVAEVVYRVS